MTAPPYTAKALADRWGCSESHIRNMIKSGELHCFRLGHLIRIAPAAIQEVESKWQNSENTARELTGTSVIQDQQAVNVFQLERQIAD
jgi:excisionase family DNA binding protein